MLRIVKLYTLWLVSILLRLKRSLYSIFFKKCITNFKVAKKSRKTSLIAHSAVAKHMQCAIFLLATALACSEGKPKSEIKADKESLEHKQESTAHDGDEKEHSEHNKKDDEHEEHGQHDEEGHGDEHVEGSATVGKGKAVAAANKKLGIQLPRRTRALLKIKTKPLKAYQTSANRFTVPRSSLVFFETQVGLYYLRDSWYNLQLVSVESLGKSKVEIRVSSLKKNDKLVTEGVALLRLTHLEAFGASGEGHGH